MEVYADRLVFRRYDVRGAVEYKPDAPWVVALPYRPSADAPYAFKTRAAAERPAAFANGAAVSIAPAPDGRPFLDVRFPTATDPDAVLTYRVEVARKTPAGWTPFSVVDVFGDFGDRRQDRTGWRACRLSTSLFAKGETYRISVTPRGFYDVCGQTIACEWRADRLPPTTVVWLCEDPMTSQKIVGKGKLNGGWFERPSGEVRIAVPEGLVVGEKGQRFRFTFDVTVVQPHAKVGTAVGVTEAHWAAGMLTAKECSGSMRYVTDLEFGPGARWWAFRVAGDGVERLRFDRLLVERIDG